MEHDSPSHSWVPAGGRASSPAGEPDEFLPHEDSIPADVTAMPQLQGEAKARLMLSAARDYALMLMDTDGAIAGWSPGAERVLGYREAEILGRPGALLYTDEDVATGEVGGEMERARTSGRSENERWHRRKDGSLFFGSGVLTVVRNQVGLHIGYCKVMRDVTDRQLAQDALRQSQIYYAAIVDGLDGIVWEADSVTRRHTFVNRKAEILLGHSADRWMREFWDSLVYEEDRQASRSAWERAFATCQGYALDFRMVDAQGRRRWFRDYVSAVRQPGGEVRLRAIMVEITSQKATERRLEMQLQVTSLLAASSTLARAAREILPILGQALEWDRTRFWVPLRANELDTVADWKSDARRPDGSPRRIVLPQVGAANGDPDPVVAAFATRRPVWIPDLERAGPGAGTRLERMKNLGFRCVFTVPVTLGNDVLGVLEFFSDFTRAEEPTVIGISAAISTQIAHFCARLRSEEALWSSQEQLRQSQKMEAIGRLAGGVAHDFNNLLTAINGFSDLLMARLPPASPEFGQAEEIAKAGKRAAALTYQLLAYSRKQVIAPQVLDLNAILTDMAPMLQRLLGEDVRLDVTADPALRPVRMDPGQLEQVVMNLAVNSRDAMPNGGKLVLATANVDIRGSRPDMRLNLPEGEYVRLSVSDSGKGIKDEVKARIFEPFFTTKESGKGTGLGLSMVYGIVQQTGGSIAVESEPGNGATFRLYLPAAEAGHPGPARLEAPPGPQESGQGTILLVEDEEGVRKLAGEILREKGYEVLSASGGEEAMIVEGEHAGPIDLLLTDFIMPGMNGREVYESVASRRPDIRVLYMSGYTEDAIVRHGVETSGAIFLQKPFSPNALLDKVQALLRAAVPGGH